MSTQQDRPFEDLRNTMGEYGRILRQRWRLALIGLGIVGSVAFWNSQYLPRTFVASTIFERRDDVVLQNLIHKNSPYSFDHLKSSLTLDMTGSRALANAAMRIGLLNEQDVSPTGPLTKEERRALDQSIGPFHLKAAVKLLNSSQSLDTIQLTCEASDPTIARRFVIALRENYIKDMRARITQILSSSREFFAAEVERLQAELNARSARLADEFEQFPGVDPTDPASAGLRLEALRLEEARLLERKTELQAKIAAREEFLLTATDQVLDPLGGGAESGGAGGSGGPTMLPPGAMNLQASIEAVEQELADALTVKRMTEEHPEVKALYRKLAALRSAYDAIVQAVAQAPKEEARASWQDTPAYREWEAERRRVQMELDELRRQQRVASERFEEVQQRVKSFESLYARLLESGEQLRSLSDQLDQDSATVAVWRQHLGQLDRILTAESEQRGTQFVLVEEPKENTRAVTPRVASVVGVCSGSGLAAAALLVALAELLDRSFRSAGQVTRSLGIPVLECIGTIRTPRERRRRMARRMFWVPTLAVLVMLFIGAAGLAYTSLEYPYLHQRAVQKLGSVLHVIGIPPTVSLEGS